jgi:phospholipid/cholesterol/gamma-HCH transport system substrate-binding protein
VVLLMVALYVIGSKRNLFSSTVSVEAVFRQVSGLRPGSTVRYMGIHVGTVERITILNDSAVLVVMGVRTKDAAHVLTSAVASLGTDGLMGSRLVNLEPGPLGGPPITDGTRLATRAALDTDAMMQTLGRTSRNLEEITEQVQILARNMNSPGNTVDLFTDTMLARDLAATVANLRMAAAQARELTGGLHGLALDVKAGKGTLGLLLADTATATQAKFMLNNLASLSDSVQAATNSLGRFTQPAQPAGWHRPCPDYGYRDVGQPAPHHHETGHRHNAAQRRPARPPAELVLPPLFQGKGQEGVRPCTTATGHCSTVMRSGWCSDARCNACGPVHLPA